jgi:hypothetical protein
VTFDLASPQAAAWNYFEDGMRLRTESLRLRHTAVPAPAERLDPSLIWAYTEPIHHQRTLEIELVDHYRCWPKAQISQSLYEDVGENGITQPLVIYSNGSHGLLGEGNHRLAVAAGLGMTQVPVVVVPDRLVLPKGMGPEHLRTLEPEVAAMTAAAARRHWASMQTHALSTLTIGTTVHVFCACGAYWKRSKEN